MKKIQLVHIIRIFIFLWILFGFLIGKIKFDFGKYVGSSVEEITIENLANLKNVSGEIYVSPINSFDYFYSSLENAQGYINIQTYEFTEKRFKKLFIDLLDRGIDIKLIMENYKYKQYNNTWKQIQEYFSGYNNFTIQSDKDMGTKYVHSKITLVDSGFWIQTSNLTHSSFFSNREHLFYSEDQGVLNNLQYLFQKDWDGEEIKADDIHPNLLVCNINCRSVIEDLLRNAKDSVFIQTQYITDQRIRDILESHNDLDMKLLLADNDNNEEVLTYFGPQKARYIDDFYVHTKTIMIDEKILLIGSMNLSDNSLDNNREIGILLIDPDLIQSFLEQFRKDWSISKGKI